MMYQCLPFFSRCKDRGNILVKNNNGKLGYDVQGNSWNMSFTNGNLFMN